MNMGMVFNMSIILFLISILGLFISSGLISAFVSRQVMIMAAIINFLNFSLEITPTENDTRVLLILGLMSFYLMEFAILFYIYSGTGIKGSKSTFRGYGLLSLEKSDWWGEERAQV